jgi:hypothetical protein
MPPAINVELLEKAVRRDLVPIVTRNAETLTGDLARLVEKVAEKGSVVRRGSDLIGKTGAEFTNCWVDFTRQQANAVLTHLESHAQELHNAVSSTTKGRNLEMIAEASQVGRGGRHVMDKIVCSSARPNQDIKWLLKNVPEVPFHVMDSVVAEMELQHGLDNVISKHLKNTVAESGEPIRAAIGRIPNGPAFLDAYRAEFWESAQGKTLSRDF